MATASIDSKDITRREFLYYIWAGSLALFTLEWTTEGVQNYKHFYKLLALVEQDKPVQVYFNGDHGVESGSATFSKTNLTLRDPNADYEINRWEKNRYIDNISNRIWFIRHTGWSNWSRIGFRA